MKTDIVVTLHQPGEFSDPLTEALRRGAQQLLACAVEAEVAEALAVHTNLTTDDGRQRLVRHGLLYPDSMRTREKSLASEDERDSTGEHDSRKFSERC